MKKCKLCNKPLPKSRISSEYCLPCEDKVDEWIRISKAAQEKTVKEKVSEQKEKIVKQAQENLEDFLKEGEDFFKGISAAGEKFFNDLRKFKLFSDDEDKKGSGFDFFKFRFDGKQKDKKNKDTTDK